MTEIEAIKAVADALDGISDEERLRVLRWATAKYGSALGSPLVQHPGVVKQPENSGDSKPSPDDTKHKAKASKKPKIVMAMDKRLDLSPPEKMSANDFAAAKAPATVPEKCVVAVYYLKEIIELDKVSAQAVFTFFKTVQWPTPADLKNSLQQAGTRGWLDTASSEAIILTSLGDNLVDHKLPSKKK